MYMYMCMFCAWIRDLGSEALLWLGARSTVRSSGSFVVCLFVLNLFLICFLFMCFSFIICVCLFACLFVC